MFLGIIAQFLGPEHNWWTSSSAHFCKPLHGRASATGVDWGDFCSCSLEPPEGAEAAVLPPEVGGAVRESFLPARTLGWDPASRLALCSGRIMYSMWPLPSRRAQFSGQRQHNGLFGSAARGLEGWIGVCQVAWSPVVEGRGGTPKSVSYSEKP